MSFLSPLSSGSRRAEMGWRLSRVRERAFWTHDPALKKELIKAGRLGREAERERTARQRDKEGEGKNEK